MKQDTNQNPQNIDTGDYVHHLPTGEDWVVAVVDGDDLWWSGFPEGCAKLSDCKLTNRANSDRKKNVILDWARLYTRGGERAKDFRARTLYQRAISEGLLVDYRPESDALIHSCSPITDENYKEIRTKLQLPDRELSVLIKQWLPQNICIISDTDETLRIFLENSFYNDKTSVLWSPTEIAGRISFIDLRFPDAKPENPALSVILAYQKHLDFFKMSEAESKGASS